MRIAQVAPLFESVPPHSYGGTERVVSYLTEELVRQGHEVTLFASGDSRTSAELVPIVERALRLDGRCVDPMAHHILQLEAVTQRADQFDIVHFHVDYVHFPLMRRLKLPQVTTLHGRLDLPDLAPLYREYQDMPVVSISDAQRTPLPFANWQATVYNGLPRDLYRLYEEPGEYLAFLGRMSPEKGLEEAIEIARRAGLPLKIAAKIDKVDQDYYTSRIQPLLDQPGIEFIGEITEKEKNAFLGRALALIFPINWPEPFGLVMTEANACGTPVVAYPLGAVPEVIRDGENGFIVHDRESAVAALHRIRELDRRRCREIFESHFTAARMAQGYLDVYRRVIARAYPPRLAV